MFQNGCNMRQPCYAMKNLTQSYICFPTAKINVGLFITGKRADSYHNIESLFYPIGIHDTLEISPSEVSELTVLNTPIEGRREDNLIWKTWEILKQRYDLGNIHIRLVKNIPMGGGIGGGSADVGFFINLVDVGFGLNLSLGEKEEIALKIGSDCPFFIRNEPALVSGRGEKMQRIDSFLKGYYLVLCFADISVGTKEAYSNIKPNASEVNWADVVNHPSSWKATLKNDFEPYVLGKYSELEKIKTTLYETGAVYASLTGTGGCLYGIFEKPVDLPGEIKQVTVWSGLLG